MISINSYLKENGNFIPFQEFQSESLDPFYIEGAIELSVDNKMMINVSMWDYVDQLWAYIIDGVRKVSSGEKFSIYFPDQPIKIEMSPINDTYANLTVDCDHKDSVTFELRDMINALKKYVLPFFEFLCDLVPENKEMYQEIIHELVALK